MVLKRLILFLSLIFFISEFSAQTRTTKGGGAGTGFFGNPNIWTCNCTPSSGDNIIISAGDAVTLQSSPTTVGNLEIKSNGTLALGNNRLDVNGNLLLNGLISGNNGGIRLQGINATLDGSGEIITGGTLDLRSGNKTILSTANLSYNGSGSVVVRGITVTNQGSFYSLMNLNGSNGSSIWINDVNSTVNCARIFMTTGNLIANASGNEVIYSRLGNQNIITPNLLATYHHLTIDGSNNKSLNGNILINGNLSLKGGNLRTLGSDITLLGDFNNTGGTLQEGTDKVFFIGSGIQTISAPIEELFYDFEVNKPSGEIQLNVDINVQNILILNGGKIVTGGNKILLGSSTTAIGTLTANSDYIVGNFERWVSTATSSYLFPIGNSSFYRPASVVFGTATSGKLLVDFNENLPGSSGLPLGDGIDTVRHAFTEGFWDFSSSAGLVGSNFSLTLSANNFNSYNIVPSTRIITRNNSSSVWQMDGSHVPASGNDIGRSALTFLPAQFAIGDTTKCTIPKPSTSAILGPSSVCKNSTGVGYSVSLTSGATYFWDITGGSQIPYNNSNSITVDWGALGMSGEVKVAEYNGCEYGNPVTLSVDINPIPADTITGSLIVQENETGVVYSVTPLAGYTYNWLVSGATSFTGSPGNSITVNWGAAGVGSVSVSASNGCGTSIAYVLNVNIIDVIKSVQSGSWGLANRWDCNCVPSNTSNVIIQSGHTITLPGNEIINYIEIESGATLSAGGNRLLITGDLINNGTYTGTNRIDISGSGNTISGTGLFSGHSGEIRFNAGVHYIASEVSIAKSGVISVQSNSTVINYGSVMTSSNLTGSNNTTSNWHNQSNSNLEVQGTVMSTGNLYADYAGNNVTYSATGTTLQTIKTADNNSYYNLTIDGNNIGSNKRLGAAIIINGNLNLLNSTFDVNASNYSIDLYGNWNNLGGTFNKRSGTVNFLSSDIFINHPSTESFYNVTLDYATNVVLKADIVIANNLTINSGSTLDVNDTTNKNVNIARNFTNDGTFESRKGLVTLNGTLSQALSGNTNYYNLTLANASGAIMSGINTLQGTLSLNSGTLNTGNNLTLLSNTSGTGRIAEITGGSITGNITMQRYIANGVVYWRMLSSAVSTATINDWNDHFNTTGFTGSDVPASSFKSILKYNEADAGAKDVGYFGVSSTADVISPAVGYFVWSKQNSGSGSFTVDVTGLPNKGVINFPITYTANAAASEIGWNLVGNPYPSAIDWNDVDWTKTNINNAIYIYVPSIKQYASYIGGTSTNNGSNIIPSSQAFWIQANGASPVLTGREGVKTAVDTYFFSTSAPHDNLVFEISGNNKIKDQSIIQIIENATDTFDSQYDARKILSTYPGAPGLLSFSHNLDYSINSFPLLTSDKSVPLMAKVSAKGNYTIKIKKTNYWGNLSCVVFKDKLLNISFPVVNDTSYTCYLYDTTSSPRFEILLGEMADVQTSNITCQSATDGYIVAHGAGNGPWDYIWRDENDSIIQQKSAVFSADTMIGLSGGIYSVTILNSGLCGFQSRTVELISPEPTISDFEISKDTVFLSNGGVVSFKNNALNASNFYWDFGDGNTSTDFEPSHQFIKQGLYKVYLVASRSSCSDTSAKYVYVSDFVDVIENEILINNEISIYSNEDRLYIKGDNQSKENLVINIMSIDGRIIAHRLISTKKINEVFVHEGLPEIWMVSVVGKDINYSRKVLVK